jgi:hypothetical protein
MLLRSEFDKGLGVYFRMETPTWICEFTVVRKTPQGVWIELWEGKRRFILNSAKKRWALPSREEAVESYIWRRRKQISILQKRLQMAQEELVRAIELKGKGEIPSEVRIHPLWQEDSGFP